MSNFVIFFIIIYVVIVFRNKKITDSMAANPTSAGTTPIPGSSRKDQELPDGSVANPEPTRQWWHYRWPVTNDNPKHNNIIANPGPSPSDSVSNPGQSTSNSVSNPGHSNSVVNIEPSCPNDWDFLPRQWWHDELLVLDDSNDSSESSNSSLVDQYFLTSDWWEHEMSVTDDSIVNPGPSNGIANPGPSNSIADTGPSNSISNPGHSNSVTNPGPSNRVAYLRPREIERPVIDRVVDPPLRREWYPPYNGQWRELSEIDDGIARMEIKMGG